MKRLGIGITIAWMSVLASQTSQASQICQATMAPQEAWQFASSFTRAMKIAKARGDLPGMRDAYEAYYWNFARFCDENDGTEPLGLEFRTYCNTDCHVQLAEYHLFFAKDIEYYFGRATSGADQANLLEPAQIQEHVNQGIRFVESGLQLLNGDLSDTGDADQQEAQDNAFNEYLLHGASFELLKAKLFMAMGDVWYKNLSEKRIRRLYRIIDEVVDDPEQDAPDELAEARAAYRAAQFGLNEALLAIPDLPYFNSLYLEANVLVDQLRQRTESLNGGLIFIGIDPDEYKLIDIASLNQELEQLKIKAEGLESRIEDSIRAFLSAKLQGELNPIENENLLRQASLSVSTYKIAQRENLAEKQRIALEDKRNDFQNTAGQFERERIKAEMTYMLKRDLEEMKNRVSSLETKREIDVLSFEQGQQVQQINDLRWMMNWKISVNNLEMQIMSLESQVHMLNNRDLPKLEKQLEQLTENLLQMDLQKSNAQNNWNLAATQIDLLHLEKEKVRIQSKNLLSNQICEIEHRMASLGGPSVVLVPFSWIDDSDTKQCVLPTSDQLSLLAQKCEAQELLEQVQIQTMADLLLCIIGTPLLPQAIINDLDASLRAYPSVAESEYPNGVQSYDENRCGLIRGNFSQLSDQEIATLFDVSQQTFQKKLEQAAQQKTLLENAKNRLEDMILYLDLQFAEQIAASLADGITRLATMKSGLDSFEQMIGQITTRVDTITGQAAGTITVNLSAEKLMLNLQQMSSVNDTILTSINMAHSGAEALFWWLQNKEEIKNKIASIKDEIEGLELEKDLQTLAIAQSVLELSKTGLNLSGQLQSELIARDLGNISCDLDQVQIESEIDQLRLRKAALIAEVLTKGLDNSVLDKEIDKQELIQSTEANNQQFYASRIREYEIEEEKVKTEIDAIRGNEEKGIIGLLERYQQQIDKLANLLGDLDKDSNELEKEQRVLATLESEIFQKSIALTESEIGYVNNMIAKNTTHTEQMKNLLEQIDEQRILEQDTTAEIVGLYKNLFDSLDVERQEMLNTAERSYQHTAENQSLEAFLSNQELVTQLTSGVPSFIEAKQRIMERSNYLLMLLKNRFKAAKATIDVGTAFGLSSREDSVALVRTAADVDTALFNLRSDAIDNQTIVPAEVVKITIPRDSGLMRQLQTEGRAMFEISPIGAGQVNDFGHFVLWHPVFGEAGAFTVLDMMVTVDFDNNHCMSRHIELVHEGSGFRFVDDAEFGAFPVFSSGLPREHNPIAHSGTDKGARFDEFKKFWERQFSLYGFLRGAVQPPYDPEALLPLLGVPTLGGYEIKLVPIYPLDSNADPSLCSWTNATIDLYLAYSMAD